MKTVELCFPKYVFSEESIYLDETTLDFDRAFVMGCVHIDGLEVYYDALPCLTYLKMGLSMCMQMFPSFAHELVDANEGFFFYVKNGKFELYNNNGYLKHSDPLYKKLCDELYEHFQICKCTTYNLEESSY